MIKGCEKGPLWNFERSQACSDNLEVEQDSGTEEIPRKVLRKLNVHEAGNVGRLKGFFLN